MTTPPDHIVEAYSYGRCLALALALHDRLGWPVWAQMGDGYIAHAYVVAPDGTEVDILGPQAHVDVFALGGAVPLDAEYVRSLVHPQALLAAVSVMELYVLPALMQP